MPGLLFIITLTVLLSGRDAFRLGSSRQVGPLGPLVDRLFQDEGLARPHFIQEIVRTKRHSVQELVRAQPHLAHDVGRPEVHETSRSRAEMDSDDSTQLKPAPPAGQEVARTGPSGQEVARTGPSGQEVARTRPSGQEVASTHPAVEENLGVEDEMERMVHLVDPGSYRGPPDSTDPERELLAGPGDVSTEASGFYGTDMEDRDRGEEGGEDRERRGGEDEERDMEEDKERRGGEVEERRGGEDEERRGGEDEDKERRGGEDKERRGGEDKERRGGEVEERRGGTDDDTHTSPGLDALIGYSPSLRPSSSNQTSLSPPAEGPDSGLQEHRASPVMEAGPAEGDLWEGEGEGEEDGPSSGSSLTTPPAGGGGDAAGTASPETDTGTDFGLLGSFTKGAAEEEEEALANRGAFTQNPTVAEGGLEPSREPLQPSVEEEEELQEEEEELQEEEEELQEEEHRFKGVRPHDTEEVEEEEELQEEEEGTRLSHMVPLTTDPPPTNRSWDWLDKTTPLQTPRSEVRGGGVTEEALQVVCVDWSKLSGRGYVVLNTTENLSCEEFRVDQGVRLLKVIERVFARRMNSPEGSWEVYLSKPTHQQQQLLMTVVSEHGVIATSEVLSMLGEIRKMLSEVGIQNYGPPSSCPSRPSPTRSDYGKLFVVLVIIGSVCMVIITSGFIYICWQRRPPATKTTFHAEELRFVENSCHDNPTLDVTNDNQPEMREKKPSTNGLAGGGEEGSRWQVFVNQAATEEEEEEEEEQDTHL